MPSNDDTILKLREKIQKKKEELGKEIRFSPVTNCSLLLYGERYNLHVVDEETIVYLASALTALKEGFEQSFVPSEYTLKVSGYTVDHWLEDLEVKLALVTRKKEEANLKKMEDRLHQLLSNDKKAELELAEIAKVLGE